MALFCSRIGYIQKDHLKDLDPFDSLDILLVFYWTIIPRICASLFGNVKQLILIFVIFEDPPTLSTLRLSFCVLKIPSLNLPFCIHNKDQREYHQLNLRLSIFHSYKIFSCSNFILFFIIHFSYSWLKSSTYIQFYLNNQMWWA